MSTAVVTGGTRGIGRAVSLALAEAGHDVIALGRTQPGPEVKEALPGISVRACDVSNEDEVIGLFSEVGPVEILINNAGISTSNPLKRITLTEWNQALSVNATGPFLCSRAVIEAMLAAGSGRIVTVASVASLTGAPYIAAYAASKHAVLGLMRSIAAEVEGSGVTANTVCPTYVRTDMTDTTIANIAAKTGLSLAEAEATLTQSTPHARIIEASEVSDAVMALVVGDANGQEVVLDGLSH